MSGTSVVTMERLWSEGARRGSDLVPSSLWEDLALLSNVTMLSYAFTVTKNVFEKGPWLVFTRTQRVVAMLSVGRHRFLRP